MARHYSHRKNHAPLILERRQPDFSTTPVQQMSEKFVLSACGARPHSCGELKMTMIDSTRVRSLASLAAILLGSAAWCGAAQAQNVTAAPAAASAAPADAAAANTAAQTQNRNSSSRGAPVDPGVRGGAPGAGGALTGLSDVERQFFEAAKDVFQEVDAGPDGLGPTFNLD